jgi:hypothetical protein
MEYLKFIETKNALHKLISKVLTKSGAYKKPETKEEALEKPQLSESTLEAVQTMTDALKLINQLHDLSVDYSKELTKLKGQNAKYQIENAKFKAQIKQQETTIENIKQHIQL